ncbi:hypothetical protein M595_1127 [Lyngbya aestuarii BL J]|uniref:Uncharacterized protein n=1 Tax=Lyngbya aestuarii BL J TaxID=1348334 RepID=U7QNH8_9CYAN|nr:hypothetical protein M595_1127 [Lyngbya aestuarii BL J]
MWLLPLDLSLNSNLKSGKLQVEGLFNQKFNGLHLTHFQMLLQNHY